MPWDTSDRKYFLKRVYFNIIFILTSFIWLIISGIKLNNKVNNVNKWVSVPCVITEIYMDVDHVADPPIFFWNTKYEYEYEGKTYLSDRYNILKKYDRLSYEEEEKIREEKRGKLLYEPVGPYSSGEDTICYVNPKKPSEAVLNREHRNRTIFHCLFLQIIVVIFSMINFVAFYRKFHY